MYPNGNYPSAIEQFDAQNGDDAIRIGNTLLYSNGAFREDVAYGVMAGPHKDPIENGRLRVRYREEVLKRTTDRFNDLHDRLRTHIENVRKFANSNCPPEPPTDAAFEELEDLKAKVVRAQRAYEKVKKEMDDLIANQPHEVARRQRAAEVSQRADEAAERLDKIKI